MIEPVTSYTELIDGIKGRLAELGIRYQDFDKLAGFAEGLTGKAFGPSQVKRLGPEKMFDALRAAALRIRIEPDAEQLERLQKQISENCQVRRADQARPNNHCHLSGKLIDDVLGYLANRKGGLTELKKAVKQARSNQGRRGARARWEKRACANPHFEIAPMIASARRRCRSYRHPWQYPAAKRPAPPEDPASPAVRCAESLAVHDPRIGRLEAIERLPEFSKSPGCR